MTLAVRRWSQHLAAAGAEVIIAHERQTDSSPSTDPGVSWVELRHVGPDPLRGPSRIQDVLRGADVLVLHSGWVWHNVQAAAAARRAGVPYVLEPRGAYDPHIVKRRRRVKQAWWSVLERKVVERSLAIHVFFDAERAHLEAIGYTGPVIVAPNGVDPANGDGWDGGTGGHLLWLGRFDPEHKGLDILVEAIGALPPSERFLLQLRGPDWRGRKASVTDLIERLDLGRWITVGNAVYGSDKRRLLTRARGFVYPSRWDACPNSLLEAVSLGIPSLATPYPLGRELAAGDAVVLADADPHALAQGLARLGSGEAAALGKRGAELSRRRFDWDRVAATWLKQVEALL
jgi:glycosyltransferase involved in cell wall biosynthesis